MDIAQQINYNYIILQTIAMTVTVALVPKIRITSIFGAISMVGAISLVNATFWDAALFFQIPNSFNQHTVLLLFWNGLIFWVLVKLLPGIEMRGFLPAIAAPVVFTLCSAFINVYLRDVDWLEVGRQAFQYMQSWRNQLSVPSGSLPGS